MKRMALMTVILMALLAGCGGSGAEDAGAAAEPELARAAGSEEADSSAAGGQADSVARAQEGGGEAAVDDTAGGGGDVASPVLTAGAGDRIVRDGTMRVRVDDDAFDSAYDQLVGLAGRFGGTVLASEATTGDDGATSGTVTMRVPTEDFDDLLVAVGRVGDVERRSITSEDVSDEFVDLEARLRHNRAQERFYLSLLDEAKDVEDAIAVQQLVEGIQQAIEQIEGRLRFLEERTSFSRLTVELFEVGGAFQAGGPAQPSLARYWATARAALINVVGGTLVVATVALPFALLGLVGLVAVRRYGVPRRGPSTPDVSTG
jgi:hypothetical protein